MKEEGLKEQRLYFKVIGGGHEWSTTATGYIWDFFKSYPKAG